LDETSYDQQAQKYQPGHDRLFTNCTKFIAGMRPAIANRTKIAAGTRPANANEPKNNSRDTTGYCQRHKNQSWDETSYCIPCTIQQQIQGNEFLTVHKILPRYKSHFGYNRNGECYLQLRFWWHPFDARFFANSIYGSSIKNDACCKSHFCTRVLACDTKDSFCTTSLVLVHDTKIKLVISPILAGNTKVNNTNASMLCQRGKSKPRFQVPFMDALLYLCKLYTSKFWAEHEALFWLLPAKYQVRCQ
jgi:hypothetical protein